MQIDDIIENNDDNTGNQTPRHGSQNGDNTSDDQDNDHLMFGQNDRTDATTSDSSSVMEIDRDEMYLSDSSDSSLGIIGPEDFDMAVRDSQSATLSQHMHRHGQEDKNRALRAAARRGDTDFVRHYIESGANIESRPKASSVNALHTAVFYGHQDVVS